MVDVVEQEVWCLLNEHARNVHGLCNKSAAPARASELDQTLTPPLEEEAPERKEKEKKKRNKNPPLKLSTLNACAHGSEALLLLLPRTLDIELEAVLHSLRKVDHIG